jgi:PKHD-type hydroxylase
VSKNIILLNAEFYRYDVYGFDYIQFGKYDAKDRGLYVWHMDSMFNDSNPHPGLFRKLSVTLLLNDDFDGGKFQFMLGSPEAISEPEMSVGTMILFPSYISHQVTEVTKGCRMSLVVWVVGPRFK